jgi:hypothetical protein
MNWFVKHKSQNLHPPANLTIYTVIRKIILNERHELDCNLL